MYIPKSFHTTLALETLIDHFSGGRGISLTINDLPDEFSAVDCASPMSSSGRSGGCSATAKRKI